MAECSTLQRANESRRRAWKEMQRLRRLLTAAGVPLPPAEKPPDFAKEGAALAAAVAWLMLEHADRLNRLGRLFIYFRQSMEVPYPPEAQSVARQGVEAFLNIAKPSAALVEELRSLSGYDGSELDAVERRCPKLKAAGEVGIDRDLGTRPETSPHPPAPTSSAPG